MMLHLRMLVLLLRILDDVQSTQVGFIQNAYLIPTNILSSVVSDTCNGCVCAMMNSNQTIVSLNCYRSNGTCDLFSNYSQFVAYDMQGDSDATFYFLELPPGPITSLSWTFDGNVNDVNSLVESVTVGNVSYISPGITGQGSALNLNQSQYVSVFSPHLNLSWNTFTFEMWVYPFSLSNVTSEHHGIVGQCVDLNNSTCLYITLRSDRTYFGFFGDDCLGSTSLTINTWYHLAFVYDYAHLLQMTYVNGVIDCNRSANALQVSISVPLTIGAVFVIQNATPQYFYGYIDQVSYFNQVRTTSQILSDATLVVDYKFTNGSLRDFGPNKISAKSQQVTNINDTFLFNTSSSYIQSKYYFVLLGTSNRSYSISLWINPSLTNGSTLIHLSSNKTGNDSVCWDMMGFNHQGQLVSQTRSNGLVSLVGPLISPDVWTHVAQTYSANNGLKVYINGSLVNGTASLVYNPGTDPYILTLGSCLSGCSSCANGLIVRTTYAGLIGEFRVYSRELSSSDIDWLAQPENVLF